MTGLINPSMGPGGFILAYYNKYGEVEGQAAQWLITFPRDYVMILDLGLGLGLGLLLRLQLL